ncbi:MAG: transcriptional regulator [Alphaproteobacteria bacterium]|nr:MucR family transcriptional regulator [Alphaproteobacteria bacterium]TAD91144.1 MAG: transcriptional regulator [Alphaproteobacteria bacterium]
MSDTTDQKSTPHGELLRMTTDVVAAYLGNNAVGADQIPDVINTVFSSLRDVGGTVAEPKAEPLKPAVPVRKSVMPDYIVCLEDGKKLKMLKRHLRTMYNMSPEDYRQKWNLPADYPMVAPNYAKQRSDFAKQIGLGRAAPKAETKPAKRGKRA